METDARYFEGKTARDMAVHVSLGFQSLTLTTEDGIASSWSFEGLRAVDPPRPGKSLWLAHSSHPGARLIISAGGFKTDLLQAAPNLRRSGKSAKLRRFLGLTAAGLAAALALGYALFTYAPQQIAFAMPEAWRKSVGQQAEVYLVHNAKRCTNPAGLVALQKLGQRLTEGNPDFPNLNLEVFDIPVTNAFAMPGGKIIIFSQLIQRADDAGEVVGVLAHEVGHIANRHAEAGLIRDIGVALVLSLASGRSEVAGGLAGTMATLSYSRSAEAEADRYAQDALRRAEIDPIGLKHFFERLAHEEGESATGVWGRIGNALSTHPGTADRIASIKPASTTSRPVLSNADWQALRSICS